MITLIFGIHENFLYFHAENRNKKYNVMGFCELSAIQTLNSVFFKFKVSV